MLSRTSTAVAAIMLLVQGVLAGSDWPGWRGLERRGVSRETNLPEKISLTDAGKIGEGFLWSVPEGGRSTPVVVDGRVYVVNKAGAGIEEQERVMCLEATSGNALWEYRFPIFLTDISSSRVGWSSPTADPTTGYVYAHGVQNTFVCLDREGNVVWERSLHEEFGVIMGYGGRTHTPLIDEDRVILSFLNASWGGQGPGRHRYAAFDKKTGVVIWWATPGGPPLDTTYSTPVVAVVNGERLLIAGNADGGVYAMRARTGETVWSFRLSKRGINVSVVEEGGKVYVSHSEENHDSIKLGRIVCIDATGNGDVTDTHEVWRLDGVTAGYSSPALAGGRLYVFDNSANLLCIDAGVGEIVWKQNVGTVMKGSPVVADGKIYVGEVNGRFAILKPGVEACETLSEVHFGRPDGTVVEIFGSPAISGGRVFFCTRDATYCIGSKEWDGKSGEIVELVEEKAASSQDAPAYLQVVPADVALAPGESVSFQGKLYDAAGRLLGSCAPELSVQGIRGGIEAGGKLQVADDNVFQQGAVNAKLEKLTAQVRVRVVPRLPFSADFDENAAGKPPTGWVGAGIKFVGAEVDGEKALTKVGRNAKFMDAETFFGWSTWRNYTVQADVLGTEVRRNLPNIGLVNSGYSFVLMGNTQRARVVAWIPMPRLEEKVRFKWDPDTWYTLKFRVDLLGDKALMRGKVWEREKPEPESWTVEAEDPTPHRGGSPALHGYSAGITSRSPGAQIYYDNVKVFPNTP